MSLAAYVRGELVGAGRSAPPGVAVGPGARRMPAYQAVPGAPWDGAARGIANAPTPTTIDKHINMPSNWYITLSQVIRPWEFGQHELLREGQILWARRISHKTGEANDYDGLTTAASLQHLNSICLKGYQQARRDLRDGRMPAEMKLTEQEFDNIPERDFIDYMGRLEQIPDDQPLLRAACKLLTYKHFKYLLPIGLLMEWNLLGVVNSISYGTSPMRKMDRSAAKTVVVTVVSAKKAHASNIWGNSERLIEGSRMGFIVRRARVTSDQGAVSGATEIVPWSHITQDVPSMCETSYLDERFRVQTGYYLAFGTCYETTGQEVPERKRRDAIGNLGKSDEVCHDAYGTLPKLVLQVGMDM